MLMGAHHGKRWDREAREIPWSLPMGTRSKPEVFPLVAGPG